MHVLQRGGGNPAQYLEEGRQVVNDLCEKLTVAGVKCDTRLVEPTEDIAGVILDAARETGASLIFLGISGKSPFARSAGGDVPIQLIRRTTIPVLLLPPAMDVKL
jgi:nucleotide-binding universal stress UspA family protein